MKGQSATVAFIHAKDCKSFLEVSDGGLHYATTKDDQELFAWVEPMPPSKESHAALELIIKDGATRCIRAIGKEHLLDLTTVGENARLDGMRTESVVDKKLANGVSITP